VSNAIEQAAAARYDALENKAIRDESGPWPGEKRHDFVRFIRRIGGHAPDGGPIKGPLDFDAPHFNRAVDLIRGEVEPESDDERRALERWRAKYPPGDGP
jgi:hypothetical protein